MTLVTYKSFYIPLFIFTVKKLPKSVIINQKLENYNNKGFSAMFKINITVL